MEKEKKFVLPSLKEKNIIRKVLLQARRRAKNGKDTNKVICVNEKGQPTILEKRPTSKKVVCLSMRSLVREMWDEETEFNKTREQAIEWIFKIIENRANEYFNWDDAIKWGEWK